MRYALTAALIVLFACGCMSANRRLTLAAYDGDVEGVAAALKGEGIEFEREEALRNFGALSPMVAAILGGERGDARNHTEAARLMLAAGAPPDQLSGDGEPVLVLAIEQERWGVALALLEAGADPHRAGMNGFTPLHAHLRGTERCAFLKVPAAARILDFLLSAPSPPEGMPQLLTPPLFAAINCREVALVRRIVGAGADLHARQGPWTALVFAAENGALDVMKFLIEAGADLRATDEKQRDICTILNVNFQIPERRAEATGVLRAVGVDCPSWTAEQQTAYFKKRYDEAQRGRAEAAERRRAAAQASFSWEGMRRERAEAEAKAAAAAQRAAIAEREGSIFNIQRDTSAYDHARACPSGGTYCGRHCCGSGMICCVPEGASNRAGGVCKAIQAGHGCWWGTQPAR